MSIFLLQHCSVHVSGQEPFAHPRHPGSKAFSAQELRRQGQVKSRPGPRTEPDIQDDRNEARQRVNEALLRTQEKAKKAARTAREVAEMDGNHNDGAFHDGQADEIARKIREDEHEDVAPAPPQPSSPK